MLPRILERELWLKVIRRAQEEAEGQQLYTGDTEHMQYMAARWLCTRSRSFLEVCEYAGLDDVKIERLLHRNRQRYLPILERLKGRVRDVRDMGVQGSHREAEPRYAGHPTTPGRPGEWLISRCGATTELRATEAGDDDLAA
jgi:hypothetical protein